MNIHLVIDRLQKLQNTKTSIQSTGKLFQDQGRKGYYKELVDQWGKAFISIKNQKKRINLLNLSNQILQRCRSQKNPRFIDDFKQTLRIAFRNVRDNGDQIKNCCSKLLYVWQDRKIFNKQFIVQLTELTDKPLTGPRNQQQQLLKLAQTLPQNLHPPPPTLVSLIKSLKDINKYKQKGKLSQGIQLQKCLQLQKKYLGISLDNYKRLLNQGDKKHLKMIVDLKTLINKIDKLQKYKQNLM